MSALFDNSRQRFAPMLRLLIVLMALTAANAFAQDMGNTLATNQSLNVGQYLLSSNKQYKLVMQGDGNLALYREPSTYVSGTGATTGRRAVLQSDGNFCMYPAAGGAASWCNKSNTVEGVYYLMLRDFGAMEIYRGTPANTGASTLVWTSQLDAAYYNGLYPDLKNAFHGDASRLMDHWVNFGRFEDRSPRAGISDQGRANALSVGLDTVYYANKYPDLKTAFGFDAQKLYEHWMSYGRPEGRYPSKSIDDFLTPPPRSAHLRDIMRTGDWLREGERMVSSDGKYRLDLQPDAQFVIYQGTATDSNRRWFQNSQAFPTNQPYFVSMQSDGHLCEYKGTGPADNRGLVGCSPSGAGGPIGRYFAALQGDGNLVIYKGGGPADNRGWIWDRITTKPSSNNIFQQAAESVRTFVVNTANTLASGTAGAANTVAAGTTAAANDLAREAAAGAAAAKAAAEAAAAAAAAAGKVALSATVNTANLVANSTEKVAVTVGRTVENAGQVVGKEIIKDGKIVGYAVANLAVDAWNLLKNSCGAIGRKVFPIDSYFQGYKRINSVIDAYSGYVPGSAEYKKATDLVNQCFDWAQDGFYCAFPAEIEKIVSQSASIPGSLVNLATRVFNEAKTEDCLKAGAATVMYGAMGLQVCALGKVVVADAQKAFACFSAAESKGVMKKFYTSVATAGEKSNPTSFPNQASCNGIGELAFEVAEKILTNGLSAEAKAAKAAGKSNTVAMVADQLRSVYKVAAAGAKYESIVAELDGLPECK
jgi:hypothetical protein